MSNQVLTNNLVDQLVTRDLDMHMRRVINASPSKDSNDYVIKSEIVLNTIKSLGIASGLNIQIGNDKTPATGTGITAKLVTFPIKFTTVCKFAVGIPMNGANSTAGVIPTFASAGLRSTDFTVTFDALAFTIFDQPVNFLWLAIGD